MASLQKQQQMTTQIIPTVILKTLKWQSHFKMLY